MRSAGALPPCRGGEGHPRTRRLPYRRLGHRRARARRGPRRPPRPPRTAPSAEPPSHLDPPACDDGSDDPEERVVASLGRYFAGERVTWTADELQLDETLRGVRARPVRRARVARDAVRRALRRARQLRRARRAGRPPARGARRGHVLRRQPARPLHPLPPRRPPRRQPRRVRRPTATRYKARLLALEARAVAS